MLSIIQSDIFDMKVDAIVNAVNTVGVMGAGLALQFKIKYNNNYLEYVNACKNGTIDIGKSFVHFNGYQKQPYYIINFPTKKHYRFPSKLEYVEKGLIDLVKQCEELKIKEVALPKLGCGLGGLLWDDVQKLYQKYLESSSVLFYVCM